MLEGRRSNQLSHLLLLCDYVCILCYSESCGDLGLDSLPVYDHNNEGADGGTTAELEGIDENDDKWFPLPCSKSKCQSDAVCYCGKCKSKLCLKHKTVSLLLTNLSVRTQNQIHLWHSNDIAPPLGTSAALV